MVVAASTLGLSRCDRMPHEAVSPWQVANDIADIRKPVLSYALLAANPHNIQPWLVNLDVADEILLLVDPERLLPFTDPYLRQIVIGHGTFLENLSIAAAHFGYSAEIGYEPHGAIDPTRLLETPVARIRLVKTSGSEHSLFSQITQRRSNKTPFDMTRSLDQQHIDELTTLTNPSLLPIQVRTDQSEVNTITSLAESAINIEMATPHTLTESIDVTRIGADEIRKNPDSIDLHGPMFW